MTETNALPDSGLKDVKKTKTLSPFVRWIREIIAIFCWSLALVHLLFFDVVSYLVTNYPKLEVVVNYRFLLMIGITALLWFFLGNSRFIYLVLYIIGYPIVILFWYVPRLLIHNWALFIAFSPAVHAIVTTCRHSFLFFSGLIISSFVVFLAQNPPLKITCMAFLGVYLILHYVRRFRTAFTPSTVFANLTEIIHSIWIKIQESDLLKPLEGDPDSEGYKQKLGTNLLSIYAVTSLLHVFGERLQEVVKSRKLDLYFICSLLYTFFLTAIIFSIEYFGLEHLIPGSFTGIAKPGFFEFVGLSISTLMPKDISPLKPVSGLAQIFVYFELFSSLLIIVLLVFVILTSIRERYKQDLDGVVKEIGAAADSFRDVILSNFELTLAGVETFLLSYNSQLAKWIFKLRYDEDEIKNILNRSEKLTDSSQLPSINGKQEDQTKSNTK